MTQEQINQLIRIYNTLLLVSTKGEDTMIMADCLRAMKELAEEVQQPAPMMVAPEVEPVMD